MIAYVLLVIFYFTTIFTGPCYMSFQEESRILKVKVVAGIGLAKKDILGAR